MPYESPNIVIVPTTTQKKTNDLSVQNNIVQSHISEQNIPSLPNISNVLVPSVMAFEVSTNSSKETPKPLDASQNVNTVTNEEAKSAETTTKVTQSEIVPHKNKACSKVTKSVKKTASWATNYLKSIGQSCVTVNPLKVKKCDAPKKMGPPPLQNCLSESTRFSTCVNTNPSQTQPSFTNTNCLPNNHVNTNFMSYTSFNPQTYTNTWQPINFVQNAYFFRPHNNIEQNAWPTQMPYPTIAMPNANYLTEYMERERQNYSYLYPQLPQNISYAPSNTNTNNYNDTTWQTPASTKAISPLCGNIATNTMSTNIQSGSDNSNIKILSDIHLNMFKSDDKAKNKSKETITNIPKLQKVSSETTQKNKNTKELIKSTLAICKDSLKLKKDMKCLKSQKAKLTNLISEKKATHKKIINKKLNTERKSKESSQVTQVKNKKKTSTNDKQETERQSKESSQVTQVTNKEKTSTNDKQDRNYKAEIRMKRKRDESTDNHDIPSKKRSRHDLQTPIKSVVRLPKKPETKHPRIKAPESDCSDEYDFDLRSKLSRKNYEQYSKKTKTYLSHEKNKVDTRRDLVITVHQSDSHDANTQQLKPQMSKPKTKKYKKIKLVINVICEKSGDTLEDSMSDDDSSKESVCENVIKQNVDLSFLDDLNIDEIVNSLEHPKRDNKQQNVRETVQPSSVENTKISQHKKFVQPIRISDIKIESDILHNDDTREPTENIRQSICRDIVEDLESTNKSLVNIKQEKQDDEMAENLNADDDTLSLGNDTYNSHIYLNDIATSDSSLCSKRNSDSFENVITKEIVNVVENIKQESRDNEIENLKTTVEKTKTATQSRYSSYLENNNNLDSSDKKNNGHTVTKPQKKDTDIGNILTDLQENERVLFIKTKIKQETQEENTIENQKTHLQNTEITKSQKNENTFLVKAIKQENRADILNQKADRQDNDITNIVNQPEESKKVSSLITIKQENLNTDNYNQKPEISSEPFKPCDDIHQPQKKVIDSSMPSNNTPISAEAINNLKYSNFDNSDIIMIDLESDAEVICLSDSEDEVLQNKVLTNIVTQESKLLKLKNDDTNNNVKVHNKMDKLNISTGEAIKVSNVMNDLINTSKTIDSKNPDETKNDRDKIAQNKNDDRIKAPNSEKVKASNVVNAAINSSKTIDLKKPDDTKNNHDKMARNKNDKIITSNSEKVKASNVVNTSKTIDPKKPDDTKNDRDKMAQNKNDKIKTPNTQKVKASNVVNTAINTSKTIDPKKPDDTKNSHYKMAQNKNHKIITSNSEKVKASNIVNTSKTIDPKKPVDIKNYLDKMAQNKNDDRIKSPNNEKVKASSVVNTAMNTSKTIDPKKPDGTENNLDKVAQNKNDKRKNPNSEKVNASNVVNAAINTSKTIDPKKPDDTKNNLDKMAQNKNDKIKNPNSEKVNASNVVNAAINTSKTIDPKKPDDTKNNLDKVAQNKNDKIKNPNNEKVNASNVVNAAINTSKTIDPKKPDGTKNNLDKVAQNKNDKIKNPNSEKVNASNVVNAAINTSKTIDAKKPDDTKNNLDEMAQNINDKIKNPNSEKVNASNVLNAAINTSKTIDPKKSDDTKNSLNKVAQNKNNKITTSNNEEKASNVVNEAINTTKTIDSKTNENTTEIKLDNTTPKKIADQRTVKVMNPSLQVDKVLALKIEERILIYLKLNLNVMSLIRNGKFSKLFKCKDTDGVEYAVKVIKDVNQRQSLGVRKEDMLKQLQNNIPKEKLNTVYLINGLGLDRHWCFLMEYYPKNLQEVLKVKTFRIDDVQMLIRQLVSAVMVLKNNNIVHSDIKPSHILMDATERKLKLCGFDESYYADVARAIPNIGTMSYRAPEVIVGWSAGFSIDVWTIALITYEMATGMKLFSAITNNDLLYKQMCLFGHLPFDIVLTAPCAGKHFFGTAFVKKAHYPGQDFIISQFFDTNKLQRFLFSTYKRLWRKTGMKRLNKEFDKLSAMHKLLQKMLVMDPRQRLPIEFVYADPFLYDTTEFTEFVN